MVDAYRCTRIRLMIEHDRTLLSQIKANLEDANPQLNGDTFLDNVFAFYPDEPNIITFLLSRSDTGITDGGAFTIGELPPSIP